MTILEMIMRKLVLALAIVPLLSGCVGTAVGLATLPFKVTGGVIDRTTTSQSEADEQRGRETRERRARDDDEARLNCRERRGSCRGATGR